MTGSPIPFNVTRQLIFTDLITLLIGKLSALDPQTANCPGWLALSLDTLSQSRFLDPLLLPDLQMEGTPRAQSLDLLFFLLTFPFLMILCNHVSLSNTYAHTSDGQFFLSSSPLSMW